MRKVFFIMMFALAGCFGIASAQVEQTPPQNSGTTNPNTTTSPNTQTPTKKQGTTTTTTTPQGTYENQGTTTTTPKSTYENQGTSTTTTPQGTYQKQGTSTTTPQGTYENQSTTTPGTQSIDTMKRTQGAINKAQGTMNKAQGTMNKTQGTMDKAQGAMSQSDKGWTKIGEKTVNMSKDRDEIAVTGSEKFSSIKIKVPEDAMVDLKNVVVEYEGGTRQNVDMSTAISPSTQDSRVIELNSTDRNVKKISFAYEPRESKSSTSTSTSKGTMSSSSTKGTTGSAEKTTGTAEREKGTMGSQGSKAKIEVWGLKSDTALK